MGSPSIAYPGYGSYLEMSLDGVTFTRIAQLKSFAPAGAKTSMIDASTMLSTFSQKLPGLNESGEFEMDGVLIPTNSSQLNLGAVKGAQILAWFAAYTPDGSAWAWQAYVSEFRPFIVKVKNAITFSAKLMITGGIYTPLTVFDPNAFDPNAFSESQI